MSYGKRPKDLPERIRDGEKQWTQLMVRYSGKSNKIIHLSKATVEILSPYLDGKIELTANAICRAIDCKKIILDS
jgi:hypothetical protein